MNTHSAELHPHVDPREISGSRDPAYSHAAGKVCAIGNGFFEARVFFDPKHPFQAAFENKVGNETFELEFRPFRVWFDGGVISSAEGRFCGVEARGSSEVTSITALYSFDWFDAEVSYVAQRGDPVLQKRLVFRNFKKSAHLHGISLFAHRMPTRYEAVLHEGGRYYPIVFYRSKRSGLFFCVDFPCVFASFDSNTFSFDYYPGTMIEPGRSFQSLTATMGVSTLCGRRRRNPYHSGSAELDVGEMQWFRESLQRGARSVQLPFLEMKAPEEGTGGPSDLEILDQCRWLGVQHVLLPRTLVSVDSYPSLTALKARMARERIDSKFVWSRDDTEHLRWVSLGPQEDSGTAGMGAYSAMEALREDLVEQYLAVMERHGFTEIEVTGAPISPYYLAKEHPSDDFERKELLHQAFQGLVDIVATLRENFGHVSSSGVYSCYGAGLARLFDAISVLVDEHPLPIADIHVGRLFADMGRLYFRRSHDFLLPKAFIGNSVGLAQDARRDAPYPGAEYYPWYLYHDSEGWRYAILSAIATGLRHRFHPLPMDLSEDDKAFAQKWLKWEREHVSELREVEEILDEPGQGGVDGYGYVSSRGAVVFLFNNSYDCQEVRLRLCLQHDADYAVRELYPREMNYLGPNEGLFRKDGEVALMLNPREARVIEAVRRSPAAAKRIRPEVFGAEEADSRKALVLKGRPGERVTVGLRVKNRFTTHEVRFPGKAAPKHIREWVYAERGFEEGRQSLPQGAFPGKPLSPDVGATRDVWLCARVNPPSDVGERIDRSPFRLVRPCWSYSDRLFFVARFEPSPFFDPIRTASDEEGVPECHRTEQAIKCGIDLAPLNIGLKAWINGQPCTVFPALAAWKRFTPNPLPVVAYFFEAGSKLDFGSRNHVVLFARHFDARAFRGIVIEHLPDLVVEKALDIP